MIGTDERYLLVLQNAINGTIVEIFDLGYATLESGEIVRLDEMAYKKGCHLFLVVPEEDATVDSIMRRIQQ